ncbi:MAG: hypothetical protein ACMUEL_02850 [Flavobacteriales bacterium Tduv]
MKKLGLYAILCFYIGRSDPRSYDSLYRFRNEIVAKKDMIAY